MTLDIDAPPDSASAIGYLRGEDASARAIREDIWIADNLAPDVAAAIRDTPLAERRKDLLWLARKPHAAQRAILAVVGRDAKKTLASAEYQLRRREQQARAARLVAAAPRVAADAVRLEVADAVALPLESDSVDLIWTSPPYGLDKPYHGRSDPVAGWVALLEDFAAESFRVARASGRLALNVALDTSKGGFRPTWPQACAALTGAGWRFRTTVLWQKASSSKGNRGLGSLDSADAPHPVAEVEVIGLFSKGDWNKRDGRPSDITPEEWQAWGNGLWRLGGETRGWEGHPAAFSEQLTDRVLRYLSRVGDVVLDPFMGSGTVPLVAWRLKRVPLGFDLSPEYVASARRRLAAAAAD